MGGRSDPWNRAPSAAELRRRARRCLRRAHWDPFERHVLRIVVDHAHEIVALRRTIVAAGEDASVIGAVSKDVDKAVDRFLASLTPTHAALAEPKANMFMTASLVDLSVALTLRALDMLSELEASIVGRTSTWDLAKGLTALGLRNSALETALTIRAAAWLRTMSADGHRRMTAMLVMGHEEGRRIRSASRQLRTERRRNSMRALVRRIELELGRPTFLFDDDAVDRLNLATWSFNDSDDEPTIGVRIVLDDICSWHLNVAPQDHGNLPAATSNAMSCIKHDAVVLLGRRLERNARGLDDDHPSMAAAPLVAALRWRAAPGVVPVDPARTVHFVESIPLSQGVVVRARAGTTWIDVEGALPDTMIAAMKGRPITDLIDHPWLDARMTVTTAIATRHGATFLVDMPVARLLPVDDEDGDPIEEWRDAQLRRNGAHEGDRPCKTAGAAYRRARVPAADDLETIDLMRTAHAGSARSLWSAVALGVIILFAVAVWLAH